MINVLVISFLHSALPLRHLLLAVKLWKDRPDKIVFKQSRFLPQKPCILNCRQVKKRINRIDYCLQSFI